MTLNFLQFHEEGAFWKRAASQVPFRSSLYFPAAWAGLATPGKHKWEGWPSALPGKLAPQPPQVTLSTNRWAGKQARSHVQTGT